MLPEPVERVIAQLARLPGVGQRTATRLAFRLLQRDDGLAEELGQALLDVRALVHPCTLCGHLTADDPCEICRSPRRDATLLCVVEGPAELLAIERTSSFRGLYHVLGGLIAPLSGTGPDDLRIPELVRRVNSEAPAEVILALPPSVDGEATALYLHHHLRASGVACSRLAQGLPMGGELQQADEGTLARAIEDRRPMTDH